MPQANLDGKPAAALAIKQVCAAPQAA